MRALTIAVSWLSVALFWPGGANGAEKRVALVIGNSAYPAAPLRNPVNDARGVGAALARLGFEVTTVTDANKKEMEGAVLEFASRLDAETAALFYYAGHGIQSRGRNYLVPIDASLEGERTVRFETLDVGFVLEELELAHTRVAFVILDACRNNPFERRFRGGSRGLSAIDAARGTLIAYATAPGSVAADGDGENGLYTAELLEALERPDLKAEEVFKQVRIGVTERSRGAQTPWESSSLIGDFVFNRPTGNVTESAAAPAPSPARADREAIYWESIRDSDDPAMFSAYLERYPSGTFSELARIQVAKLAAPGRGRASGEWDCPDLAGTWQHRSELCESTVYLAPRGDGNYDVAEDGCGNVRATGRVDGSRMRIDWTVPFCTGYTELEFDRSCRKARGEAVMTTNFLLCAGRHPNTMEWIGERTEMPHGQ